MNSAPTARRRAMTAEPGVSFLRTLRSEWIKFTTLRSTWILLGATILLTAGLPVLFAGVIGTIPEGRRAEISAGPDGLALIPYNGLSLAQLIIGSLAVLYLSAEYATGMIRSTMTAAPRRLGVLAAKGVILAVVSYTVTTASVFIAFAASQPILASYDLAIDLAAEGVLRSYLLGGLYVVGISLIGLGLAELLRNSAGAITTLAGLIFVLPIVLRLIPGDLAADIARYLPGNAGTQLFMLTIAEDELTQLQGGMVLAAWVVAILGVAAVLLKRRDV